MNKYLIKINGRIAPNSYTYEDLVRMKNKGFTRIEIKKAIDRDWSELDSYIFQETNVKTDYYKLNKRKYESRVSTFSLNNWEADERYKPNYNNTDTANQQKSVHNHQFLSERYGVAIKLLKTISIMSVCAVAFLIANTTVGIIVSLIGITYIVGWWFD